MNNENWLIEWAFMPWWRVFFPFGRDEWTGKWGFVHPSFKFVWLKGRPTETRWHFDWYLHFGYLYIYRKAKPK